MAQTLEERVADLEKKHGGATRFFVQYLLSPLAVVVLGAGVTYGINREQRELQHLEVAQTMLSALFSPDRHRALATKRLMDEVITDDALRASLDEIVQNYFNSQIDVALASDNPEVAKAVVNAASAIGGTSGAQIASAETRDKIAGYEQTRLHEVAALEAIAENRFDAAAAELARAEAISPELPPVRALHELLQSRQGQFDDPVAQAQIKDEIIRNFGVRVPASVLQDLRTAPLQGGQ